MGTNGTCGGCAILMERPISGQQGCFDMFSTTTKTGRQFGPILGLPAGGSCCFNRVPRVLLVRINWSTAPDKPPEPIYDPFSDELM